MLEVLANAVATVVAPSGCVQYWLDEPECPKSLIK
jgi:cyclic lactone autoinducer peptide